MELIPVFGRKAFCRARQTATLGLEVAGIIQA